VDTLEEEAPTDLEAVKTEIARIEAELATTRLDLTNALKSLGV
jgi:hypothetical protein